MHDVEDEEGVADAAGAGKDEDAEEDANRFCVGRKDGCFVADDDDGPRRCPPPR